MTMNWLDKLDAIRTAEATNEKVATLTINKDGRFVARVDNHASDAKSTAEEAVGDLQQKLLFHLTEEHARRQDSARRQLALVEGVQTLAHWTKSEKKV